MVEAICVTNYSGKIKFYYRWVLKWVLNLVPRHNMDMLPRGW